MALNSESPIEIVNVKHARLKETDRIAIIARELVKLGIKVDEKEDGLILESTENLTGAELNSENDHRLFMAFCIAGMFVGNCTVTDPESVKVSYPNFIEEMNRIGAKIQPVNEFLKKNQLKGVKGATLYRVKSILHTLNAFA